MEANLSHFHSVSHALEWAHSAGHFNHTCDHFKLWFGDRSRDLSSKKKNEIKLTGVFCLF